MHGYLGDLGIQYFQLAMKQVLLHYCTKNINNLYNRYACIFYQNFCLAMFKKKLLKPMRIFEFPHTKHTGF